ncbi:MAG: cell division protein FtsZ [Halobacteriovoraceae bacterium]|nr:cell division protein FtsZ [Halobacteriovoraceae bacterium]
MFEIAENKSEELGAKIIVVGIGGGGGNAVNTMIKSGLKGVRYVVANTDAQALQSNLADEKIQLGVEVTKGLGAGANPEIGRKAALEDYEELSQAIEGADMVFITAGMGGGTGTGAAPIIAKLSRELGALTVGVITKPFSFEGKKRMRQASEGIKELEDNVDSLITIPNQRLLLLAGESLSLVDTFKKADEVLLNAVKGISDLINNTGLINADFADVATVMNNRGLALMGTGISSGNDRAIKAATEAISSPLLEDVSVDGATGLIVNITGNSSLTAHEANEAMTLIMEAADENAEIIFGTVIDENMSDDEVKVTVIATGLKGDEDEEVVSAVEEFLFSSNTQEETPHYAQEIQTPEPSYQEERYSAPTYAENHNVNQAQPHNPAPAQPANLAQSFKSAANEYEMNKAKETTGNEPEHISKFNETPVVQEGSELSSRSKSIAEKLGFINFNEDEFDSPSFMRNSKKISGESTNTPQ